jgi:putative ABC transport system permease protein
MKYLSLVWAGLWRRKTRTILTLLSAVTAFFLLGLLEGVNTSIQKLVDVAHLDRLYVANSALLPLPQAYLSQLEKVPGVQLATYVNAGLGSWRIPRNAVAIFAVDPERYFDMLPEMSVSAASREAMRQQRQGVIVAAPLARKFGWKLGDRISLHAPAMPRADGTADWPVVIVGFCDYSTAPDTPLVLLNFAYFDNARIRNKGTVQRFVLKIADPAEAARISDAVDALFANSPAQTRTETEKDFAQESVSAVGDVGPMVTAIMGAVFFTLLLLVGNVLMQSFRERTREFAVLKAIGYSDAMVAGLVAGEALLLTILAGFTGMALARITLPVLGRASGGLVSTEVSGLVMGVGIAAMLAVSLAAGLLPALNARRLSIVGALAAH